MIYTGEECYGVIYTITHKESGKKYVGQSTSIKGRWSQYKRLRCEDQPKLHNALRKHGISAFAFEVVYLAYDKEQLDWLERWFIDELDTINYGYNCREGGASGKHTAEARKKMSEVTRKRFENPEEREKARRYGEDHPESREKTRVAVRKYYDNRGGREIQSAILRKYCREHPEKQERQRMTQLKRYEDPEVRKKTGISVRKHYENNPEVRNRQSAAIKEMWRKRKLAVAQKTHQGSQIWGPEHQEK